MRERQSYQLEGTWGSSLGPRSEAPPWPAGVGRLSSDPHGYGCRWGEGYKWKKMWRKKDRELEPERWTEDEIERREELTQTEVGR